MAHPAAQVLLRRGSGPGLAAHRGYPLCAALAAIAGRLDERHPAWLHRCRRDRPARAELDLQPALLRAARRRRAAGRHVPAPPAEFAARAGRVPVRAPHPQTQPPHAGTDGHHAGWRGTARAGARCALACVCAGADGSQPAGRPAARRGALRAQHRLPPPGAAQLAAGAPAGRAQRSALARGHGRNTATRLRVQPARAPAARPGAQPVRWRRAQLPAAAGPGRRAVRPRRHALRGQPRCPGRASGAAHGALWPCRLPRAAQRLGTCARARAGPAPGAGLRPAGRGQSWPPGRAELRAGRLRPRAGGGPWPLHLQRSG